jgi:phosphate starvation-inducible membrane PsiE
MEGTLRRRFGEYLGRAETAIYSALALLLVATALVTIVNAAQLLWSGVGHWSMAAETLRVLNEILIVLMLVELLHTVGISIRSHMLAMIEPFLIVGLIASIRRILVITLETATLSREGLWATEGAASIFHGSMTELALLGGLILVLVACIAVLRRFAPVSKDSQEV